MTCQRTRDHPHQISNGRLGERVRRAMRGVGEQASEVLWPTRCVACDMPGELLCEDCRKEMPWICQRWACPVCGAPFGWLTCTCCERDWETRATVCALSFGQTASQLVSCLKDRAELRLASVNAAAMATALDEASGWPAADGGMRFCAEEVDALCFVPATSAAYTRRGFDHMELVARELTGLIDVACLDCLARISERDQRELGKEDRARNLQGTVRVTEDIAGMRLLLIDDVITTGSSIREATRALLARGAHDVTACALTRVW